MNKLLWFVALLLFAFCSFAQTTRDATVRKPPRPAYQSAKKQKKGAFAFLKKDQKKPQYSDVAAFRARLEKVYKEKAKQEKLSNKKRYKKPGYFGHKRMPKKRPPGKQKFCKVCRIMH